MESGINRRIQIDVTKKLISRFRKNVHKRKRGECWEWKAAFRNGYGAIKHQGQVLSAHRLAFVIQNGEPDESLVVAHRCDNKACCNPHHLEAVTPGTNNRDARGRGTFHMTRGEDCHNAKLTDAKVRKARKLYATGNNSYRSLASKMGVSKKTMEKAIKGETWSHVKATV